MLFYVCAWKIHYLSPKQKESFSTLTMVGLRIFTFSKTRSLGAIAFPSLGILRSAVNALLVHVGNVVLCEQIVGFGYKALE